MALMGLGPSTSLAEVMLWDAYSLIVPDHELIPQLAKIAAASVRSSKWENFLPDTAYEVYTHIKVDGDQLAAMRRNVAKQFAAFAASLQSQTKTK